MVIFLGALILSSGIGLWSVCHFSWNFISCFRCQMAIPFCRTVFMAIEVYKSNSSSFCYNDMPLNADISKAILATAEQRGIEKSTCPSEIARMLFPADWRKHMSEIVGEAIELQHKGKVVITQKGKPVDIDRIKGPIRITIR